MVGLLHWPKVFYKEFASTEMGLKGRDCGMWYVALKIEGRGRFERGTKTGVPANH